MTLEELYEAAAPGLTRRDANNLKTSIKYLARALGKRDAADCQPADYLHPWPDLKAQLDTFFSSWPKQPSPATIYNTRRNLRLLFRQPAAQRLAIPSEARGRWRGIRQIEEEIHNTGLYRHRVGGNLYRLSLDQWPPALQRSWERYYHQMSLRVRDITLAEALSLLERYVGYLINIRHSPICRWQQLFEVEHLDAYVRWQAARHQVRMTTTGEKLATRLCAIAQVQELPQLAALRRYKRDLPPPEPMHDEDHNAPEPADLERTGTLLLAHARQPYYIDLRREHPGLRHALLFARGLILRLLVRIPLRARNIITLQCDTNLFREDGIWSLRFRGDELKVGRRGGRPNTWRSPWPPDLVPELEEYLTDHRPKLPGADMTRYLFLTKGGRPYTRSELRFNLNIALMKCTGKRFYTHWARHIYATHMRDEGAAVETVAHMLNNTPQVVYANYYQTREAYHYAQAETTLQRILKRI
jgi:integrase